VSRHVIDGWNCRGTAKARVVADPDSGAAAVVQLNDDRTVTLVADSTSMPAAVWAWLSAPFGTEGK
jgi:hypothetical protein